MFSLFENSPLKWILVFVFLDFATSINYTDIQLDTWESWGDCNVTCGQGHQTRSRTCPDLQTLNNCSLSNTEVRICFGNQCIGKTNSSKHHKGSTEEEKANDNAINSAVYSTLIFIPGIIGFIFVCFRTHRKTKMEEERLKDIERRKLSLRDDAVT
ncbi:uncharacterized protein LOC134256078 [Saccostrea cucullata]|uniref:uncharacterized protein LOC134256078 n=1 Tax=Saccostrea cuccullata TaxID=36930 RepID=UPI002ED20068